jgi:ribose 5-phosphate isomerase A
MLLNQGKLHTILGIPTSKKTYDHVVSLETTLSDLDSHPILDLAIDGADKVLTFFLSLSKAEMGHS